MPNVLNGHPDHYSVISFLFKFKNCTCNDLCRELQLEQSKALKILRDLEITYHLIDRVGQNRHQSTVYALNDNGTKYAAGRKMTPGNQTMSDIWASEAEKELATTRTALADAKRQLADEQAKTAELSHKVSQLTGPKIGILPG